MSLDPLNISWASQLRFHQTVSTPHHVISVRGWGWQQGFDGERMGVDSHGGWLWALASQMLLITSQPRPQISWTPFHFYRRSCQISAFSRNSKLCGIQDSASHPHATIALPQAVIQIMESLTLQWKHLRDTISLLTAHPPVCLWQDPQVTTCPTTCFCSEGERPFKSHFPAHEDEGTWHCLGRAPSGGIAWCSQL